MAATMCLKDPGAASQCRHGGDKNDICMWKYLIEKEFRQFFRDPMLPRIVIVFPLLMMLVFPFAANMEVKDINLVVVDSDRTDISAELIEKCTGSGYFRLKAVCDDPREAQEMMDRNAVDAILTIGQGFSRSMATGEDIPVGIKVNTVNGTKGSISSQYLSDCIMLFMRQFSVSGPSVASAQASVPQSASAPVIDAAPKYYYNPYMDYKVFMVPALMVIAVTMVTGFFPALNIVGEKEAGTIEQMNVSPVSKTAFIVCKMIPYWVITFFMLGMCLLIAWLVFGYVCRGSLWGIVLFTVLHIMVTAGLGLLISSYSENAQQAMFIMMFFVLIFMLMSGVFTPVSSMPAWARAITYANPLRYYADAMRAIFLKGSSVAELWYDAAGLLTIGAAVLFWAVRSYRKTS